MIHIGYSGGGLKGIGHLGIAEVLDTKIKPNILSGISVGSIMAILHALVVSDLITWKQVREVFFKIKPSTVFSTHPYSFKGMLRAILSFIIPSIHSIGKQDNLDDLLKSVVTEDIFNRYRLGVTPEVYVGWVDYKTGELVVDNLKLCSYNQAINSILASSHVPVLTESIKMNNTYGYDGGLFDHCISHKILKIFGDLITININVFSRPKDNDLLKIKWEPKNILNVLTRTLELGVARISRDDEELIEERCKNLGVSNYSLYLPSMLDNMYDFTQHNLYKLYLAGRKEALSFEI